MRFQPADSFAPGPSRFQIFRSLLEALRRRVLTVRARHFKEGAFTATGGAVWFETERIASGGGLVEGSTPECRGVRQLVTYQRAQDGLLAAAAQDVRVDGRLRLIKNCRDSRDNVYGAQENYEATVASGWRLRTWRLGLLLLLPVAAVTWLGMWLLILAVFIYLGVAGLIYLPIRLTVRNRRGIAMLLFGRDLLDGGETGMPLPAWLEWLLSWGTRLVSAPLAVGLILLLRCTVFVETRRKLLALLVSRSILAGAGSVDRAGRFGMAEKAPAINTVTGLGGFLWDRPIYNFGHFFKAATIESFLGPKDYRLLFRDRQRLQIGLGDSNMAEVAEFLRVGTTLLVLDAVEAGYLEDVPLLSQPIRAMHQFCRDPLLQVTARVQDGKQMTALEIQRYYACACRRFLKAQRDAPAEAHEVLRLWTETLDALETAPESLVGSIDWVTKRFLLDKAGEEASWEERKKIDIRYHELSDEGYFQILRQTGIIESVVASNDVQRAMRSAPPGTPATSRGHYIREFADGDEPLAVNWKQVVIGHGRRAKVIRLDQPDRREPRKNTLAV
jgi:proteasome accessory factor A